MRLLLDTCCFIWALQEDSPASATAKQLMESPDHLLYVSAVSIWELGIKYSKRMIVLPVPFEPFINTGIKSLDAQMLALDDVSALYSATLPPIHRDPFDRMLIAQALAHGLTILTPDDTMARYGARTIW